MHKGKHSSANGLWSTSYSVQACPLGDLLVDVELKEHLKLPDLTSQEDTDEHSIEMMYPFLSFLIRDTKIPILPIYVSNLTHETDIVGKIWNYTGNTVFVFSSDFCHWGERFQYLYNPPMYNDSCTIYKKIEDLDSEGMKILKAFSIEKWKRYLRKTGNTICGREPLEIMISLGRLLSPNLLRLKWLNYGMSSYVETMQDSSVSYASGCLIHYKQF